MKPHLKRLMAGVFVLMLTLLPLACKKNTPIDDSPQLRTAIEQVSRNYVMALLKFDFDKLVAMSDVPFVGEDRVFQTKSELKAELSKNNPPGEEPPPFEFVSVKIYHPEEVKIADEALWKMLEKYKLLDNVYVATIVLKLDGHEQPGSLILKPDSNGDWKVVGVF